VGVELPGEEGVLELTTGENDLVRQEREAGEAGKAQNADPVHRLDEPSPVLVRIHPDHVLVVVELGARRTLTAVGLLHVAERGLKRGAKQDVLLRGGVARLLAHGGEKVVPVGQQDQNARALFPHERLTPASDLVTGAVDHCTLDMEELTVRALVGALVGRHPPASTDLVEPAGIDNHL